MSKKEESRNVLKWNQIRIFVVKARASEFTRKLERVKARASKASKADPLKDPLNPFNCTSYQMNKPK